MSCSSETIAQFAFSWKLDLVATERDQRDLVSESGSEANRAAVVCRSGQIVNPRAQLKGVNENLLTRQSHSSITIGGPGENAAKTFVTACDNVVFCWKAVLTTELKDATKDTSKFIINIYYKDGPLPLLKNIDVLIYQIKPDKSSTTALEMTKYEAQRGKHKACPFTISSNCFQKLRGSNNLEPLRFRIIFKIPLSTFSFSMPDPPLGESCGFLRTIFQHIEDASKAAYANVKLISRDGKIFYCDKVILGNQSPPLAAMFRHPPAANAKEGEYEFPTLCGSALKTLLEFIYTGQATLTNLSIHAVIEVGDVAEQYGFSVLMQACGSCLWKRVAEKPEDCFVIICFAGLHDELKYLKHRAFDVLADNYKKLSMHEIHLTNKFGEGSQKNTFVSEFNQYMYNRVEPDFLTSDSNSFSSNAYGMHQMQNRGNCCNRGYYH